MKSFNRFIEPLALFYLPLENLSIYFDTFGQSHFGNILETIREPLNTNENLL